MGQSRPLFIYFRPFHITISIIQIEISLDGAHGIQTSGRRLVGADKTTKLWRPPTLVQICKEENELNAPITGADPIVKFSRKFTLCLFVPSLPIGCKNCSNQSEYYVKFCLTLSS